MSTKEDEMIELVKKLRVLNSTDSNDFLMHFKRGSEAILKIRDIETSATLDDKNINLAKAMKIIK